MIIVGTKYSGSNSFAPCKVKLYFILVCAVMLSGCDGGLTPDISAIAEQAGGPTVNHLVEHIQCEIAAAIYENIGLPEERKPALKPIESGSNDGLWQRLIEENFVASVTLTLQVTNNEGLNPSLTFPTPFNPIATPGLTHSMPVAFTGNFTLGVNGQLDGSQYRTFNVVYLIDLKELYYKYYYNPSHDKWTVEDVAAHRIDCPFSEILSGNLGLAQILYSGLQALDTASNYNVYATPDVGHAGGPTVRRDLANRNIAPPKPIPTPLANSRATLDTTELEFHFDQQANVAQTLLNAEVSAATKEAAKGLSEAAKEKNPALSKPKIDVLKQALKKDIEKKQSEGAKGAAPVTGPNSAMVYFNSTVQFAITAGLSGGPSWTLRNFTGPNSGSGVGGSGANGGGGKTSGGGGGGGSGGSASSGVLNVNRTELDSLLIQVAATCRIPIWHRDDYWNSVQNCSTAGPSESSGKASSVDNVVRTIFQPVNALRVD